MHHLVVLAVQILFLIIFATYLRGSCIPVILCDDKLSNSC